MGEDPDSAAGECNALMVPDIDRATRDPRTLEDLIDAVELYGLYVASLTGNINHGRGYFRRAGPGE
jgi:hypothetical protein